MRRRNAYQVLHIKDRNIPTRDIRTAYSSWKRSSAKVGAGQDETIKRTREEEAASFEILSNEKKRAKYDEALELTRSQLMKKIQKHCFNKEGDAASMNMLDFNELDLEQLRRIYVIYDDTQSYKLLDAIEDDAPDKPLGICMEENTLIQMLNTHLRAHMPWRNPTSRKPLSDQLKNEIYQRVITQNNELMWAIRHNDKERIHYLLENGAQVSHFVRHKVDNVDMKFTIFTYAVFLKCPLHILDALFDADVINIADKTSNLYAITMAVFRKSDAIFDWCIEHGALLDVKDNQKRTLLMLAIWKGTPHMVNALIASGKIPQNAYDEHGNTALHYATIHHHVQALQALLDAGAYVNIKNVHGNTPLHVAIFHGHVDIADMLIQKGANMAVQNVEKEDPLIVAINRGKQHAVDLLLRHGANVTHTYENGASVLHYAVNSEHVEIVHKLLRAKANPNVVDELGNTPLILASDFVNPGIVEALLKAGANPNAKNHEDLSAISFLVEKIDMNDRNRTDRMDERDSVQTCMALLISHGVIMTDAEREIFERNGIRTVLDSAMGGTLRKHPKKGWKTKSKTSRK
jgi:ankyrin repeat protein